MKLLMVLVAMIALTLSACSDSPRRQLSSAERSADMAWIFSKFDHNYAPREYKEGLHSFDYEATKQEFLAEAQKDQTNEEFFRLVHRFVAKFKDAHTSAALKASALPGRARLAYLGFSGVRKGNEFVVTKLLPTIKSANFPIKVGDKISALDGQPLLTLVNSEITPYADLGHTESNHTALMGSLFTKDLNQFPAPKEQDAVLTLNRGQRTDEVKLPWVIKDASIFGREQLEAIKAKSDVKEKDLEALIANYVPFVSTGVISYTKLIDIFSKTPEDKILNRILDYNTTLSYFDSFEYFSHFDVWTKIQAVKKFYGLAESDKATEDATLEESERKKAFVTKVPDRRLGFKNYSVSTATVFPAAVLIQSKTEKVGYIKIDSFSVPLEDAAVKEFKQTLQYFHDLGINKLVIDLLNNGGGSLSLGARLAQTLSPQKINMPTMLFKLNDNWIDSFENAYLSNSCLLYTSPSPRDQRGSRMPSSA